MTTNGPSTSELDHWKRMCARLTTLHTAIERLHAAATPVDVCAVIEDITMNVIGGEACAIYVVDESASHLSLLSGSAGVEVPPRVKWREGLVGTAAASGHLFMNSIGDLDDVSPWERKLRACVPLKYLGRVVGAVAILGMRPSKKRFAPIDVELFDLLGRHGGLALNTAADAVQDRGPEKV